LGHADASTTLLAIGNANEMSVSVVDFSQDILFALHDEMPLTSRPT
jgi:hypothetical protein